MKLFLKIFLLFLCAFAPLREVFAAGALFTGPVIVNGNLQLTTSTNAPLGSAVTTNSTGGAWGGGGTQTLFYAVQSTNGLGSSALGRTVAGIVVSTNNALRIKWNLTAGADAIFLWRGSATNTLTNYVRLAASVTNYTDTGTNTWSNGTVTITATNTPRLIFADGTSLSSTNGLGGGGGVGSGTLTGAVVGAGSSSRLTTTNNGTANVTLNFDATGLATGTPLYVQSETNANARLASNVWAAADSTTNYVRRTGDTMTGTLTGPRLDLPAADSVVATMRSVGSRNFIGGIYDDVSGVPLGMVLESNSGLNVPQVNFGGAYLSGNYYGPRLSLTAIGNLDGAVSDGDFARFEYVGSDNATQRLFSVFGDAGGATAASAKLYITNAVVSGDGAGLSNITVYGLGDIRAYGAVTNADATAAIASALAINNVIYFPPGTWTASNIVISGTKTFYGVGYESWLLQATNATGDFINAGSSGVTLRVASLRITGGSEINRATNTVAGNRNGIRFTTQDNNGCRFMNLWISGFSGYGIYASDTNYTGNFNDVARIYSVSVQNCYIGIAALRRSEFVHVDQCFLGNNAVGMRAGAGNPQITGSTFGYAGTCFDLTATDANDAHGLMAGCKFYDSPVNYTIRISTNTLGFTFTGNSIYHGAIYVENSRGAIFQGNQISATYITSKGPGTNYMRGNVFGTGDANTITNDGSMVFVDNYNLTNALIGGVRTLTTSDNVATTLSLTGLSGTLSNGKLSLTNTFTNAASGGATNAWTLTYPGGTNTPTQMNLVAGSGMSISGASAGSTVTVTFASTGTGGTSSASSYTAAWAVNVYQPVMGTQNVFIKIGYTNVEYDTAGVYNTTNWTFTFPTGLVTMVVSRAVLAQNANFILGIYMNGAGLDPLWDISRVYAGVDGVSGLAGTSSHTFQWINRAATNQYDVRANWNTPTRTTYGFRCSGTVQN